MGNEKFEFTIDWQRDLLRFTATDKNGYRALDLYDESYFDLLDHVVIAKAFKQFHSKYQRVPREASLVKEELVDLLKTKDMVESFTKKEQKGIMALVDTIYHQNAAQKSKAAL